ncbi:Growth hormone secretagogue receptor type 1 [Liparis tanakae]|uniref:Growth hormone secretagogue receptor type 1 n=1 Tax=Liparis tanakae TaxID=230148 RepID=A0A4Z2ENG1_9TELE|nr:Growth hormone secretagogue receptor type 1 [Liparis tanakae]
MPSWPNLSECFSQNCSLEKEEILNATRIADYGVAHPLNYYSIPLLTGITIACTMLFPVGVAGNVMTILVVGKYRDMRTTTNLYLCSMAVSDLLIFLCMPLDLYRMWRYRPWRFGAVLCKLFQFVSESSTYSTILSITALSVERYLAICFPLRAKALVTKRRVRALILILWTVSLFSAGPVFVMVGVERDDVVVVATNGTRGWAEAEAEAGDTRECTMTHYAVESGLMGAMVWLNSVFFFMPVFCLTYCNLVSVVLFYLSAAINPVLYNTMSWKYRGAAARLFGLADGPRPRGRTASSVKGDGANWTGSTVSF